MEVSGVSTSSVAQSSPVGDPVAISLQKKAQEIQQDTAQQLLEALPDPSSSVGQNIDVSA